MKHRDYAGPCAATEAELHKYWHLQNGQNVSCPFDCEAAAK